jgi:hypothetical protein
MNGKLKLLLVFAGVVAVAVASAVVAWAIAGTRDRGPAGAAPASGTVSASEPVDGEQSAAPSATAEDGAAVAPARVLQPGAKLTAGESVGSPNGRYSLVQQSDGNLVLVDADHRPQWDAQTYEHPGAYTTFDSTGDLIVKAPDGRSLWHSASAGRGAILAVQDDGNAVIYTTDHRAVWSGRAERVKLYPDQRLTANQRRRSADGRYTLLQQPDGNLVVMDPASHVLWGSQTSANPGAYTHLGGDGNLVVYSSQQRPLWSSATTSSAGASVVVNNDGNVVITAAGGAAVWGTATEGVSKVSLGQRLNAGQSRRSPNGKYKLLEQPDGNLVLRDSAGQVLWSSATYGHPGAYTRVQHDGNVVVYDAADKPLWSTRTYGSDAAYLLVQDDGNVVLYGSARRLLWSTQTAR